MLFTIYNKKTNIESWCQKVLDLLDLMFAELCDFMELHGTFPWMFLHYFFK